MEIEEYYNENHHLSEESLILKQIRVEQIRRIETGEKEYRYVIRVPGREWQELRLNHISDYSNVTLPGFYESCESERPFIVDIFSYLRFIISAHSAYPSRGIYEKCNKCHKEYGVHTSVMSLP